MTHQSRSPFCPLFHCPVLTFTSELYVLLVQDRFNICTLTGLQPHILHSLFEALSPGLRFSYVSATLSLINVIFVTYECTLSANQITN